MECEVENKRADDCCRQLGMQAICQRGFFTNKLHSISQLKLNWVITHFSEPSRKWDFLVRFREAGSRELADLKRGRFWIRVRDRRPDKLGERQLCPGFR